MFKKAADGDRRTISNFVEIATLSYITSDIYVSDNEMDEILNNSSLTKSLKSGMNDVKKGNLKLSDKYSIAETETFQKKLKGEYEGIYRYRIGNFRLFYTVESGKILVIKIDIEKRKNSYK